MVFAPEDCMTLVPSRVQAELLTARAFDGKPDGTVVQAPRIDTLSQWVARQSALIDLLNGKAAPCTPAPLQLAGLWEAEVGDSFPGLSAAERVAMAKQARDAQRMARQWGIKPEESAEGRSWHCFRRWFNRVEGELRARNWHTAEDWSERLIGQLARRQAAPGVMPAMVRLQGFSEFTRLETGLMAALGEAGVKVDVMRPSAEPRGGSAGAVGRRSFASHELEAGAAAAWAGRQLSSGQRRLAIVVNGLDRLAPRIRRILENVLEPGLAFGSDEARDACFRLSSGSPLAEAPLVRDALMLLRFSLAGAATPREFPELSRFLLSRHWGAGRDEHLDRARLELRLRKTGRFRWTLAQLAWLDDERGDGRCSRRLPDVIRRATSRKAGGNPAGQLVDWLNAWGWPGQAAETEDGQWAVNRLLGHMEAISRQEVAGLDACLDRLERSCKLDRVAGPGGQLAPVQVISLEEAYGLRFDAAWVMNLSMQDWPPGASMNPFLPASLLERVPRGTENGALEHAERLTAHLLNCADQVQVSWCNRLDDLPVSVSPLAAHLPELPEESEVRHALWQTVAPGAAGINGYRDHPWLEASETGPGLPLQVDDGEKLVSAVTVLNYQSACPLAAYLACRLHARMDTPPAPFAGPAWRGELVHAALESLLAGGAATFQGLDEAHPRIGKAIEAALQECAAEKMLLPVELQATRESLRGLLAEWLELEGIWRCGEVEHLEWRQSARFGRFEIDLRIDRVNRLADGRTFLVDYKTGSDRPGMQWADERTGDVQLPLYTVLLVESGEMPAGLSVARVRPGECELTGLTDDANAAVDKISGFEVKPRPLARALGDWESAIEQWRARLNRLAEEYLAGDARHQEFRPEALKYAGLDLLLRSGELARWWLERGHDAAH